MVYVLLGACGFLAAFSFYLAFSKDRAVDALLKEQALERGAWASERCDLNNRLQHPEIFIPPQIQSPRTDPVEVAPLEPDESFLVGTIQGGDLDA